VLLNGGKVSTLNPLQFKVYITLWALAVKHRSYVLSRAVSNPEYIIASAKLSHRPRHFGAISEPSRRHFGAKSATRLLKELHDMGLIEILPSGRINVIGVKEVHPKLLWDRCPENVPITDPL
jgi:hypothetical protein